MKKGNSLEIPFLDWKPFIAYSALRSILTSLIQRSARWFDSIAAYSALRSMFPLYRRLFRAPLDSIVAYSGLRSILSLLIQRSAQCFVSIFTSLHSKQKDMAMNPKETSKNRCFKEASDIPRQISLRGNQYGRREV